MVSPRRIGMVGKAQPSGKRSGKLVAAIAAVFVIATQLTVAQNYDPSDTTSIYPLKGTFYHDRFEGRKTANGEIFSQNKLTAAHWKIKLGTLALVTNVGTGQQVIVRVNDRCPRRGVFDMSRRAARAIGIRGSQPVEVRLLGPEWYDAWVAQDSSAEFETVATTGAAPSKTSAHHSAYAPIGATKPSANERYDIVLGCAKSPSEATEMLKDLPEKYHQLVKQHAEPGADGVLLILQIGQPHSKTAELQKSLLPKFPEASLRKASN